MADREQRGGSLLQVPTEKRSGISPVRYRSRSKSKRSRSGSPLPYLMKEDREKSPFEIGETKAMLKAAPKAVLDKALVMDISPSVAKAGDEEVIYITTDMSVIDKALVMDISSVTLIVLEDEDEEEEIEEIIEELHEDAVKEDGEKAEGEADAEGDGEVTEKKKVVKKVVKKKKKKVAKKEETPPLKLEIKVPKKDLKGMFDKKPAEEAAPVKKPIKAAKLEKLKMMEKMKAEAAAKAAAEEEEQSTKKPSKWDKPNEKKKPETIEEKLKRMKAEELQRKENQEKNGLMAVLDKQKKKLEDQKKKGMVDPADARKMSKEQEIIDYQSGLRKVSVPEVEIQSENGDSSENDGITLDLKPIPKSSYNENGDEEDEDDEKEKDGDHSGSEDKSSSESELSGDENVDHDDARRKSSVKLSIDPTASATTAELEKTFFVAKKQKPKDKNWKPAEEEQLTPPQSPKDPAQTVSERERDAELRRQREAARPPTLETFLKDLTIREYESLKLTVSASGPDLNIRWFKNGNILEKGSKVKMSGSEGLYNLIIPNAVISDSGTYSITIKNKNGEASSKCAVTVYKEVYDQPVAPTITSVRDFYHSHDDELILECHVRGEPKPDITWYKEGLQIFPNMRISMQSLDTGFHRLIISKPLLSDSGKYTIKASNEVKRVDVSHNVQFTGKESHLHVYGIYHSDPKKLQERDTIKKAHEETMEILANIAKKENKGEKRSKPVEAMMANVKSKLIFGSTLRDRTSIEGNKIKLVCSVVGPDPQMRWFKNDVPLVFGPKIKNGTKDCVGSIELVSPVPDDSGTYKCVAKNGSNEISTSCKLLIYSKPEKLSADLPPTFTAGIRDVYHTQENDLILSCKVRGVPPPTITWLRDEMEIINDDRIQAIQHHDGVCELVINKPTRRDSGKYMCRAENTKGIQKITHNVVVDMDQQQSYSTTTREMSISGGVTGMEGMETLTNGTTESDETKAAAKGKPAGKEKGKKAAGGRSRPIETLVSVKDKLSLTAHLTNRTVAARNRVKLQCCFSGPEPQLRWFKNGTPVVMSTKIKNGSRDGLGVLEFTSPSVEDSGEYTCTAKNAYSEVSTSCILNVYDTNLSTDTAPIFTRTLKDTYHLNTNELIIECLVRGDPKPKITWIKDDFEIDNPTKYQQIDHDDGTCELIINNPNKKDSGKYICRAENRVKSTEISHYVEYEGKAHHIFENIHGAYHVEYEKLKEKEEGTHLRPKEDEQEDGSEKKGKKPKEPTGGRKKVSALSIPDKKTNLHFAAFLTDRCVPAGSRVKLSCYVEGPEPQIRWFKNDIPVVVGPKIKNLSRDGLGALEFSAASVDDSGVYKCVAKNATGEIFSTATLTVYKVNTSADVAPLFTRAAKDTYCAATNELILECHARGTPTPEIYWVRDAVRVQNNDKYKHILHEDGTTELIINNPVRMDNGKYTCIAENSAGKVEIIHTVEFEPKVRVTTETKRAESPPPPPTPVEATEEKPKEVTEEESTEAKPAEEKKTVADKKPAPRGKKGAETSGRRRGAAASGFPDPKQNLYFTAQLASRTVPIGSRVKLFCYISGPEPQVRWLKNGTPLVFGQKIRNTGKENIAAVEFMSVTMDDNAEYTCVAKNIASEITSSAKLTVFDTKIVEDSPPTFVRAIKDTYYIQEDELVLECRVRGEPTPSIQWLKDGLEIRLSDKYKQFNQSDGFCKLVINEPTSADNGLYTCRAENSVKTEKISHTIEFTGKDQCIQERVHGFFHRDPNKPHFSNLLSDHTVPVGGTIALQAEMHTQCNVEWLKGRNLIELSDRVKTFAEQGVYTLTIENATPEESGQYTCRATNAFGKAETTANVDVVPAVCKGGKPALFLHRPDAEMSVTSDTDISMSFRVQGDPKPKITWLKGLRDITKSPRTLKEVSDDYTRFTLTRANYNDSGTYCIIARNRYSADRAFVTVTITKPIPKPEKVEKEKKSKKSSRSNKERKA